MIETRRAADSPKSASPEETRERMLSAAREVIAKKGKRGATTREIADVAGVNEATLFRHFGTKEALIVAVAQHFCGFVALRGVAAQL
ncbi:MAG: helix-turn-helix domain-containing protein, partial [Candidatus Tumulicola sp.]